jgi:hypothetical protein
MPDGSSAFLGLRYAFRDPDRDSWSLMTVDPEVRNAFSAIVVDREGTIHFICGAHGVKHASGKCDQEP